MIGDKMETVKIFGINIFNITMEETCKLLDDYLSGNTLRAIYTPNTEIVMLSKDDKELSELLNKGDLIIPDGIGLIYGSRIKKKPLKERVTGFDTSIKLLEKANDKGYSLYLLGGKEGVAKNAADNIKKNYPNINIKGYHHGYFKGSHLGIKDSEEENKIIEEINRLEPDIIFVGMGFPKQEIWIDSNKSRIKGKVIIGNGGVMDILAGNSKRAPEIFQKLGLEWFYRLIKEPSRIKRQILLPKFLLEVIFSKNVIE